MTPGLSYYREGARESSATIINGMDKKNKKKKTC